MKVSNKTDYALRVLFTLVESKGQDLLSTRQLAERNDIPKKFLEQILIEMKQKGWVASVTGKRGGYRLGKPPGQINMGEVIRHFDGILAPIACVSVTGYKNCTQQKSCRFRRLFLDIRNYIARTMEAATLESVFKTSPVTRDEVFEDYGAGI